MNKTIWVLSTGDQYDGYSNVGVFSTREKALEKARSLKLCDNEVCQLEEYNLDGNCVSSKYLEKEGV